MDSVTSKEKNKLSKQFREFQLAGLESSAAYLIKELAKSDTEIKRHYKKYIENQIGRNKNKTEEASRKLAFT
ncbi:hypothetical protein OAD66_02395 [Bacteroidia bacterium]|nr:hypothetical protein [Bacteroidia bacterium]